MHFSKIPLRLEAEGWAISAPSPDETIQGLGLNDKLDRPPIEVCEHNVLHSLDVLLHLGINAFAPLWEFG